ncbi:MAG: hypothetical protein ACI9G9_000534 [Psychromonas sp.]|jgi:hypothetical protein
MIYKKKVFFKRLTLFVSLLALGFNSCSQPEENKIKINGLSFVATSSVPTESQFNHTLNINANSVAIMPFGFMPSKEKGNIVFNHPNQWEGETPEGIRKTIQLAHKLGQTTMLKPQLWISKGYFTGFLEMDNEEQWLILELKYREFILSFAKIAEEEKSELFCIGTELGRFVAKRPKFWIDLVDEIKTIYSGKITYAENWDCFDKPIFLSQLDYIGVDAYFPLTDKKDPSEEDIKLGWAEHLAKLKLCSETHNIPVLFTECGYRSIDFAGEKPWDYGRKEGASTNLKLQSRLLQVMFDECWSKEYIAGGYIWKWFPNHEDVGGLENNRFTPQNKPAEKIIATFYGKGVEKK